MALPPNGDASVDSYSSKKNRKPSRLSMGSLQRTLSLEMSREAVGMKFPAISEVVNVLCECCGMCEECTPAYIQEVRDKYCGNWICGLCSEAVNEEIEKKKMKKEDALTEHLSFCSRFNRIGKAYPALYQAEAMKEILKKSIRLEGRGLRAKCNNPEDGSGAQQVGIMRSTSFMRSTSCMPAITREMSEIAGRKHKEMNDGSTID